MSKKGKHNRIVFDVSGHKFYLSKRLLQRDAPNRLLTLVNKSPGRRYFFLDTCPDVFAVIVRHLQGYSVICDGPLVMDAGILSQRNVLDDIEVDASYYKLKRLAEWCANVRFMHEAGHVQLCETGYDEPVDHEQELPLIPDENDYDSESPLISEQEGRPSQDLFFFNDPEDGPTATVVFENQNEFTPVYENSGYFDQYDTDEDSEDSTVSDASDLTDKVSETTDDTIDYACDESTQVCTELTKSPCLHDAAYDESSLSSDDNSSTCSDRCICNLPQYYLDTFSESLPASNEEQVSKVNDLTVSLVLTCEQDSNNEESIQGASLQKESVKETIQEASVVKESNVEPIGESTDDTVENEKTAVPETESTQLTEQRAADKLVAAFSEAFPMWSGNPTSHEDVSFSFHPRWQRNVNLYGESFYGPSQVSPQEESASQSTDQAPMQFGHAGSICSRDGDWDFYDWYV